MHSHIIDHYQKIKSPIHRLDGRIKLVFIVAYILSCSLLPMGAWPAFILLFSVLIVIILISEVGIRYVFKRSILVLPFLFTALPLVFKAAEPAILALPIGENTIVISQEGLNHFINLGVKTWLSVIAAILLASTTSFTELLIAMRSLKLPRLLVAVFGLMWRYLFLMIEEVGRLIRARDSRSGHDPSSTRHPGRGLFWRAAVTGGLAGSLFIRSLERSERVYGAMLARGYDGEIRSLEEPPLQVSSLLWLAITITSLFLLIITSYLLVAIL
jgi:cobalt/nickel transport system permease protein